MSPIETVCTYTILIAFSTCFCALFIGITLAIVRTIREEWRKP